MLGVDRTNEKVADLFDVRHPAVLRAVKRVNDAAQEAGCPLSICGLMSKDPRTVYYMIGLGIRKFSMEPGKLPGIQDAVSKMDLVQARKDAEILSELGTLVEVRKYLDRLNIPESSL
jgi:phosphoenolpyruvate-protein kinase (PTS system EI component)